MPDLFFDTLVSAHRAQLEHTVKRAVSGSKDFFSPTYTEDPFSVTVFTRNLIRGVWEEFITRKA